MMVLPNITANMSFFSEKELNMSSVCEINQLNMLQSLEKLPKIYFLFVAMAFLAMVIYIYVIPYLKSWKHYKTLNNSLIFFVLGSLTWATLFGVFTTFNISDKTLKIAEYALIVIGVVLVFVMAMKMIWRKKK